MTVETTQKQTREVVCYLFRSHGPRRLNFAIPDPAAAHQMRAHETRIAILQRHRSDIEIAPLWVSDYCRRIKGLGSLPTLKLSLTIARENDGEIFIDDLRRLMHRCEPGTRGLFCDELMEFGQHLHVLARNKPLAAFSQPELSWLLVAEGPFGFRQLSERPVRFASDLQDQTCAATRASASARRTAALSSSAKLSAIRAEIEDAGGRATLQAIADIANAQGLRTARGTLWSEPTVSRALKRMRADETPSRSPWPEGDRAA